GPRDAPGRPGGRGAPPPGPERFRSLGHRRPPAPDLLREGRPAAEPGGSHRERPAVLRRVGPAVRAIGVASFGRGVIDSASPPPPSASGIALLLGGIRSAPRSAPVVRSAGPGPP